MTTARRHHYVPQFYLRGFSLPRKKVPQVEVFDRNRWAPFQSPIANIAAERDFNRIDVEGLDPNAFEEAIARIESKFALALQRIIAARSLRDEDDRAMLLNLIALLFLRNPRRREFARGFHERVSHVLLGNALATPERWGREMEKLKAASGRTYSATYEDMRRFVREKQYDFDLTTGHHISIEMMNYNRALLWFFRRNWVLLKAPQDTGGIVTSDHPVLVAWSDPEMQRSGHGAGLAAKNTDIIVPISHRLALIGRFDLEERELDITEEMVTHLNARVIGSSHHQVYAYDLNFTYVRNDQLREGAKLCEDQYFIRARPR